MILSIFLKTIDFFNNSPFAQPTLRPVRNRRSAHSWQSQEPLFIDPAPKERRVLSQPEIRCPRAGMDVNPESGTGTTGRE